MNTVKLHRHRVIDGEAVKKRRLALGLTAEQLARAVHVKKSNISAWELGKSTPVAGPFFALCRALEVEYPEELLRDPPEAPLPLPKLGRPPKRMPPLRMKLQKR